MSIHMGDLFNVVGGMDANGEWDGRLGDLAGVEQHLMQSDYLAGSMEGSDVVSCKRCGAAVLAECASVHLGWHRRIEGGQ